MENTFLIEDHCQALDVWRKKNIRNLDLVHLDAHIDFGFYQAKPEEQVAREAKSLQELKRELEKSLLFQRYQRDFSKQTNIGNYIYPAMCEGIVRDFYWVIPGPAEEFKRALKFIKVILKNFSRQDTYQPSYTLHASRHTLHASRYRLKDGIISTKLLGRDFYICTLESLPILKQRALLDIDLDFLTTNSLLNADNTSNIGKSTLWIYPDRLVKVLKEKIKSPEIITIAYSVNGGYTPLIYKFLGDDLNRRFLNGLSAQEGELLLRRYKAKDVRDWEGLLREVSRRTLHVARFTPHAARCTLRDTKFESDFKKKFLADVYFNLFNLTDRKEYYLNAVKSNPAYRVNDNNYGPLYLARRQFSRAKEEFSKIAMVDSKNPYALAGLGAVCLLKRQYQQAKRYFLSALEIKKNLPYALLGLAKVEFSLKNLKKAKKLFCHCQTLQPLDPQVYYFLGRIYEKEKNFEEAALQYQDAMRLGLNNLNIIKALLRVSSHIEKKDGIVEYAMARFWEFKKGFTHYRLHASRYASHAARNKLHVKRTRKLEKEIKGLEKVNKQIRVLERMVGKG